MAKVSVDLSAPSPYVEPDSFVYRMRRRMTYAFALRLLRKRLKREQPIELLEIGTGSGFFLAFVQSAFPKAVLSGLEYDPRLLEVTRARAPFAKCLRDNAEEFDFGDKRFDVIVSFQVVEHLYNPDAMLHRVRQQLKPNGIFLVTSPNLDGLGARIMGNRWHGYREDHVSLKGCREWRRLIESDGFVSDYLGSTFFSGIPWLNCLPLGVCNWFLLATCGCIRWNHGESFVGVFRREG